MTVVADPTLNADISVDLGCDREAVPPATTAFCTAIVTNAGPSTATGVALRIVLPTGMTVDEPGLDSEVQCSATGATTTEIRCTLMPMPPGRSNYIRFGGLPASDTPPGTILTLEATVTATSPQASTADDTDSATLRFLPQPTVTVTAPSTSVRPQPIQATRDARGRRCADRDAHVPRVRAERRRLRPSSAPLYDVTVDGNATYSSQPFVPPAAGEYRFAATYQGDENNGYASTSARAPPWSPSRTRTRTRRPPWTSRSRRHARALNHLRRRRSSARSA